MYLSEEILGLSLSGAGDLVRYKELSNWLENVATMLSNSVHAYVSAELPRKSKMVTQFQIAKLVKN